VIDRMSVDEKPTIASARVRTMHSPKRKRRITFVIYRHWSVQLALLREPGFVVGEAACGRVTMGPSSENSLLENQIVSAKTRFERFGEVKTYHELGMEQGNRLVPLSTLVALGWRRLAGE